MKNRVPLNCAYLEYLMEQQNWSNVALSDAIGVSEVTIANWKRGLTQPTSDNLNKLAEQFSVDKSVLTQTDAQISQGFLRKTLIASVQKHAEAVDIDTMIKIMKTLGLNIVATQKVEVDIKEDLKPTEVEDQSLRLLYGKKNIEGDNASNRE